MSFFKVRLFRIANIVISLYLFSCNLVMADFFQNISGMIDNNVERLSYGVSVTDINQDDGLNVIDIVAYIQIITGNSL